MLENIQEDILKKIKKGKKSLKKYEKEELSSMYKEIFEKEPEGYLNKYEIIDYLLEYEKRFDLEFEENLN